MTGLPAAQIEELYRARAVSFARAVLPVARSGAAARTVVTQGFVQALRRRGSFLGPSPEAWVWGLVWAQALELRRARREPALPPDRLAPELVPDEPDAELAAAIRALPDRQRLCAFLRWYAELSQPAIADILHVGESTVRASLGDAHVAIATSLGIRPDEARDDRATVPA